MYNDNALMIFVTSLIWCIGGWRKCQGRRRGSYPCFCSLEADDQRQENG